MEKLYRYLPEERHFYGDGVFFAYRSFLRRISLKREGETTLSVRTVLSPLSAFWAISSIFSTRRTIACLWVAGLLAWGCCLP